MNPPDKMTRKALKEQFHKVSFETWDYLFDHEKENGLAQCRTQGFDRKMVWYDTKQVKQWLVCHCYYAIDDFKAKRHITASPWAGLVTTVTLR